MGISSRRRATFWLAASDFPLRIRTGTSMVRSGSAGYMGATAPPITAARTFGSAPPAGAAIRVAVARCPGTTSPGSRILAPSSTHTRPVMGRRTEFGIGQRRYEPGLGSASGLSAVFNRNGGMPPMMTALLSHWFRTSANNARLLHSPSRNQPGRNSST